MYGCVRLTPTAYGRARPIRVYADAAATSHVSRPEAVCPVRSATPSGPCRDLPHPRTMPYARERDQN
jgi:hypothetical protein